MDWAKVRPAFGLFWQIAAKTFVYLFNFAAIRLTIALINLIVLVLLYIDQNADEKLAEASTVSYDFVVVGAGTAGLTIAHALAEKSYKVLLLEAGGYSTDLLRIPYLSPALHGSDYDWRLKTEPQEFACGAMRDRQCAFTAGRGVGGSNLLNNMIYHRGHPEDFRGWFNDRSGEYDYEELIQPYFEKLEKFLQLPKDMDAAHQTPLGLHLCSKLNKSDGQLHFDKPQLTQTGGKRSFGTKLHDSVTVVPYVTVTRLVMDTISRNSGKRVAKLEYFTQKAQGELNTVDVRQGKVVLSGGAIGSPKILLLSGIGNCAELLRLGVKCEVDLPSVGRHLQDHLATGFDLLSLNVSMGMRSTDVLRPRSLWNYFARGTGPLTSGGCDALGWMNSANDIPDVQFMSLPVGISADSGVHLRHTLNFKESIWDEYFSDLSQSISVSIIPILLHPKSEGTVRLRTADPTQPVLIQPNYLQSQEDVKLLVQGLREVTTTIFDNLQELGPTINRNNIPGCRHLNWGSDAYWNCYVTQMSFSVYHPAGTCKLGKVVDNHFRVFGVENLFVVDASVMPNLPSANPNSVVGMLAFRFVENY